MSTSQLSDEDMGRGQEGWGCSRAGGELCEGRRPEQAVSLGNAMALQGPGGKAGQVGGDETLNGQ